MRHLIGTGLAVVVSAAIFLGGGWAYGRLFAAGLAAGHQNLSGRSFVSDSSVTIPLGVMAGVALLIGLALLIRWVSPLATGLPGLVLVASTVLYVVSPARVVRYIPLKAHDFGVGFEDLVTTGILGAAGVVLVLPLFFPSRWRRPAVDGAGGADDPIEATAVTSPSSTGLIAGMGSNTWQTLTSENPKLDEPGW